MSKLLSLPGSEEMLNTVDQHGNTPIMMAAKYSTMGIMMILLNHEDTNLEAVDNMGRDLLSMIRLEQGLT